MTPELRTIAVDLTPVLPGGENGGAKVFVLELLRSLAALAPRTRFVLLTRRASHEELAQLDAPNMQRRCVLDRAPVAPREGRVVSVARKLLWLLPEAIKRRLTNLVFLLRRRLQSRPAASLMAEIDADLLFCPFTSPTYAEAGVPVVSTLYDLQYRTYPEFFTPEDVAHRDAVFRAACRDATHIAAISDYARDSALRTGELEPGRIRTIPLRIARRLESVADPDDVLSRHGLAAGRYLLYPANFWRHKNHEMLIAAFGIAVRSGLPPDFALVCTGAPGERRDFLCEATAAFDLQSRVLFPGYVTSSELGALIGNAAGVVFPSLYEGFGLPVLEAMAAGVPVACSNRTSLPEVASGAALLFDPGIATQLAESMLRLANDAPLRASLIEAGYQRAHEYADTTRMAQEYLELFAQSLEPGASNCGLSGVYEDGWVGPELRVFVDHESSGRLELEFVVPDWLPHASVRLEAAENPRARDSLKIRRGCTRRWTLLVRPGRLCLRISPAFVPAQRGHGDDRRELTLMLSRCEIHLDDGRTRSLWTRNIA